VASTAVTRVSYTQLACVAPAVSTATTVIVYATNDDVEYSSETVFFAYYGPCFRCCCCFAGVADTSL
jgi:hypothetical protein